MGDDHIEFWFDFVDPGSYLARELLGRWTGDGLDARVRMRPLELRPPPEPLIAPGNPGWSEMEASLGAVANDEEITFAPPALVPWTRKAHELALHAAEKDTDVHGLVFRGRFAEGLDVGRVDVLLGLAQRAGLDVPETRTVLGVDRFAPAIEEARREAREKRVRGVPTLIAGGRRLEGFRSTAELRGFAEEAGLV